MRHRVAANLVMIMMILAGAWAARHVTTQFDPDVQWPGIWVEITWPGASAEDVEQMITIPVQQQLRTIPDIKEVRSITVPGRSRMLVEMDHRADLTLALDHVKQQVATVRNLPGDIEPPVIHIDRNLEDIATILVTGPGELAELVPLVRAFERQLRARGIEDVQLRGMPEQELAIMVGTDRLTELDTTLEALAGEIARLSTDVPAGTVGRAQGARQLRGLDQQRSVQGFELLEIGRDGDLVRLKDFAEVRHRSREDQVQVRQQGRPAIEMVLNRARGTDAFFASRIVYDWLDDVRPELPEGVTLDMTWEARDFLADQLTLIGRNGLTGLALVVLVLLLFLGGRAAGWVSLGIPVSFALALAIYWGVFDGGINILALIAFIMATGIVVDDAIVVGEDIVTQHQQGLDAESAAVAGARRMWTPVATASLTTLAAFAPLLLFGGPFGEIILTLPMVLLCIILASLVECFLVLPHHLKTSLARPEQQPGTFRRRFDAGFETFREQWFRPLLQRALARPGVTLCCAVAAMLVAFSLMASQRVGLNMVTGMQFESLQADIRFAASATPAERDAFIAHLEDTLLATREELGAENIEHWVSRSHLAHFDNEQQRGPEYASIHSGYAFEEERSVAPQTFLEAWQRRVTTPPVVEELRMRVAGGPNAGGPDITFRLRGRDAITLKSAAEDLAARLARYDGVTEVGDDLPWGREQWIFRLTSEGRALGLTPAELGRQLHAAYNGHRVQIFNRDEAELEVRVMLPDAERRDLASLRRFQVATPNGGMLPLATVAELESRRGIDTIRHVDGELAVRVSAWVDSSGGNAMQILTDVRDNALPDLRRQWDVESGLSGKSLQDEQMLQTMQSGALLTLVFIYLILTWVFASWIWPLAIMITIPFGLTGAIAGHWLMGMDMGVMSLLAFFALTGVVVNDSIVLVTFFRRAVDAGSSIRDALEYAACSRLRAVILTTLTTIAGLSPLLFETSSIGMFIVPIAVTLSFGLAFATLLVLLVVPALILLIEGASQRVRLGARRILERAPLPAVAAPSHEGDLKA